MTAPLTALIVDDEALARRGLRLRLAAIDDVRVVTECANGREALTAIARHCPDVVFLDIQMPGLDGFDVVRELQADSMPLIVFVTAFDRYAVNAFEVHAVDYLLKPVEQARLEAAVNKARALRDVAEQRDQKSRLLDLIVALTGHSPASIEAMADARTGATFSERLTIRDGEHTVLAAVQDIAWIDAAGDYMCIHVGGKTHVMRITMNELQARLDPALFLRIHRSTLVNANHVVQIDAHVNGEYFLELSAGMRLKVSRGCRAAVARFLPH